MVGDAQTSGRKAVGSLSLGGGFSETLNSAVNAASASGVLMVVAAGNDAEDACGELMGDRDRERREERGSYM
jgi:subtilisin family serine protease